MDDLISRQAAIDELMCLVKQHECDLMPDLLHWTGVKAMLESLPSAYRTGRWKYVKKRLVRGGYVDASECSVCHKRIMPHLKPNFCPNCGAEMIGEANV